MNFNVEDGEIIVIFPMIEVALFVLVELLVVFFGVLCAVIVSRGIV